MLKSYKSLVFNTFSFEPSKTEIILIYREVPELLKFANESMFPSPLSASPPLARTPPVDLVHGASVAKWTRGSPPRPLGLPLGPSSRRRASPTPPRAALPCNPPLLPPPPRRRAVSGQTDLSQTPLASPRSPPAYKYD